MGLIDDLFGADSVEESTEETDERKFALLLSAGPEQPAVAGNGFNYALELDEGGYEVQMFLDGKATQLPGAYAEDPDRPFNYDWEQIQQRGLLAGACGYCANAFDAAEACETAGIDLLSDETEHAPAVTELADRGYEMLTIG